MLRKKIIIIATFVSVTAATAISCRHAADKAIALPEVQMQWIMPDTSQLPDTGQGKLIRYGRSLIANTSYYLGPKGVVAQLSNGMNCENCHLYAGTKFLGNNFSLVATGYPRFKPRSGKVETIVKKIEDCFERSLNGKKIDTNSREMKAFVAYLQWIGKDVLKGTKPKGSGIEELPFLDRPADTARGRVVFETICRNCHGKNGQGQLNINRTEYTYPPLWGPHSYNTGASLYRISKLAGYVKNNMPFGPDFKKKHLTVEQAWDVAAFVNSKGRPVKDLSKDWPDLATKPYDYPFGPYADKQFSEQQHKYGPYGPISKYYALLAKKRKK